MFVVVVVVVVVVLVASKTVSNVKELASVAGRTSTL